MPNATARAACPASSPSTITTELRCSPPGQRAHGSPGLRQWLTLAVVVTAAFLGTLDFFIINVALPAMQADLHASFAQVQLVIAAYGLAYAVCLITGGRLGDIVGRKKMFLIGVAGFTLASVLCGLAPRPELLIAARVLQGIAGAMLFPQVLSIIQVTFPPHERGRAFAVYGVVQGAASFSGVVLGGFLVQANLFGLGWRPIFLVNLPVGLLTLLAAWKLAPESRSPTARRLDLGGVAVVSVALMLLVYPLVEGPDAGWPWWAFICLAAAPPALAGFLLFERRVQNTGGSPLVELGLFRSRAFTVGVVTSLAFCCGLSAFFLTVTLFLQKGLGLAPTAASMAFAPFAVGYLFASGAAVRLARRLGHGIILLGAALMALALVGIVLLTQVRGQGLSVWELMPLLLLYGMGQGLAFPSLIAATLSGVPAADAGSASGVLATFQQVAFSMGIAIIGGVFAGALGPNARAETYAGALAAALLCNIGLLALTLVLAYRLPRRQAVTTHGPAVVAEI
ncbi:MAG TPA: MFS transporter [Gemmataceae bacterium]|nr:MFS transporter [Gemmataceae bacterium]